MSAKEPFNSTYEVYRNQRWEELFKDAFNIGVFQEVDEVVNIKSKGEQWWGWRDVRVGGINDVSSVEAWVRWVSMQTNGVEGSIDLDIPVTWATL